MSVALTGLDAFAELTLNKFDKNEWVDIAQELQNYTFASRLFKKNRNSEEGGKELEWKIQTEYTDNTRDTQPYDTDTFHIADAMTNAKVGWSWQTNNITWDVNEEEFQSGPTKIISVLKTRWHSMWMDYFGGMERRLWSKPASSSVSPTPPFGIPYWIVKNATEGFSGGNPAGFTAGAGGVDAATYPGWKNWSAQYVEVSRLDLVKKIIHAVEKTHFKAPHNYAALADGKPDWMLHTVYSVYSTLKEMQEPRNQNLGADIGYYSGKLVLNGIPIEWVPIISEGYELEDTSNPVYGIWWNKERGFHYFYKEGQSQKLSGVKENAFKHTVRHQFLDNAGNFRMRNRRLGGFVIYK
jgi:hypothetical protein